MSGATFSEIAGTESIRGELFRNNNLYGIKHKSRNGVHLSGGPFEALFEIDNFLKGINIDFSITKTKMYSLLLESGRTKQDIEICLQNPKISINETETDLFSITENVDSIEAIKIYKENFKNIHKSF